MSTGDSDLGSGGGRPDGDGGRPPNNGGPPCPGGDAASAGVGGAMSIGPLSTDLLAGLKSFSPTSTSSGIVSMADSWMQSSSSEELSSPGATHWDQAGTNNGHFTLKIE